MGTCVFCGRSIEADEPVAGRAPMAAHAACADAALADDAHWDRVAAATPESEPDAAEAASSEARRDRAAGNGGCLALLVAATVLVLSLAFLA